MMSNKSPRLLESKIVSLSFDSNTKRLQELENTREEINGELTAGIHLTITHNNEHKNKPSLNLDVTVNANDAQAYNLKISTVSIFLFPEGTTTDDQDSYLKSDGLFTAFSHIRTIVPTVTAAGLYGSLTMPELPDNFTA